MYLNERKIRILEAIINDYILTAEPIGSRTIAKKYDLGISSATIRNEMSDLEEMGFIIQPHASAGRVPSDKGYRFYVDTLMHNRELSKEEAKYLQDLVVNNIDQIDFLMKETAKAISVLTNYTTIVSEPKFETTKIKHLQLIPVDENTILLVMIINTNSVKNQTFRIQNAPDMVVLTQISFVLNKKLAGLNVSHIDKTLVLEIKNELGEYGNIGMLIVDFIISLALRENDLRVYTSGVKNILAFPEFNDIEKAKAIFHTLEEKDMLITLLDNNDNKKISILIGEENINEGMHGCSIIKTNYTIGDENHGTIGIIGPTRMDYPQAIAVLNGIVNNINKVISSLL